MLVKRKGGIVAVRLFDGEDFFDCLKKAVAKTRSRSAVILGGVGMVRGVETGFYKGGGAYEKHFFKEPVELISLQGNVAREGKNTLIHAHACLGLADGKAVAGHLAKATAHYANEVFLLALPAGLRLLRKFEEETSLKGLYF